MKCELHPKHSRIEQQILLIAAGFLSFLCLMFAEPVRSYAQMFSVGEERERYDVSRSAAYVGIEPVSVTYHGPETSPDQQQPGGFAFEGPLIRLRYETTGLNLFLATGGTITGIEDHSYFDVGGRLDYGFPVHSSREVSVLIPLSLQSVFTTITNSQFVGTTSSFRFGSLVGGAGLEVRVRATDDIRFVLGGRPSYGLAFASGGFFGGSLGILAGEGRIYFDRVFGDLGLSVGYDYSNRNYDVDEDVFDYRINAHSLQLGITF